MMGPNAYSTNAGVFKNTQNYIVSSDGQGVSKVIFEPLAPFETPEAVTMMCSSFNETIKNKKIEPLILIPIVIHDFLSIHPFNDGNGRMSLLITTLLLLKSGYDVVKYISIEKLISDSKGQYYDVLEASQSNWHQGTDDSSLFIAYLLLMILNAYSELDIKLIPLIQSISALETVRKAVKGKIGKFTKRDIWSDSPSLSEASIVKSLTELYKRGEITRFGTAKSTYYLAADKIFEE